MNTKFQVPSDEKRKRERRHGFLAVNAISGVEYFMSAEHTSYEVVALFLYKLALARRQQGCTRLVVCLDNNSTHLVKMKTKFGELVKANQELTELTVEFKHTARYSPKLNLADYLIHQVRLRLLHHLPAKTTIQQIEQKLSDFFNQKQLQSAEQIRNTLNYIFDLVGISAPQTSGI